MVFSFQRFFELLKPSQRVPDSLRQSVYIANILSLIFSGLTFVLVLIIYNLFGAVATLKFIIAAGFLFLLFIVVNRSHYNLGRLLFCLTPIWITLFVTLYSKYIDSKQSYLIYFDSRFILLAASVLPVSVFLLRERVKLYTCLGSALFCIALFDPIHNALGLGYHQRGFGVASYYYINYITVAAYFVLVFGLMVMKTIAEKTEQQRQVALQEKEDINNQLSTKNKILQTLNEEAEARNEEFQQQQEELSAGKEKLEEAYQMISAQKDQLNSYNTQLQILLDEKSKNLLLANEELVKHNNELRQFSYTVSHNLRGPVARLLGLAQLMVSENSENTKNEIVRYIHQSTIDLDEILKDLSMIIDIRNELHNLREKISLQEEFDKVWNALSGQIKPAFIEKLDFKKAPYAYGIRPMLHSVFYNLISNAVKYQSPDRPLQISILSSVGQKGETIIEVCDNGLGMDLEKHRTNLFKLYKRFHTHVLGKGLGLFIVKTQMEIMGGTVEVESQLNRGTTFRVIFPRPQESEKQVFFENDAAKLYFDAEINATVISWKRVISSNEYREVFEAIMHTLKTYNTSGWIADLREQGKIEEHDQIWFVTTVIPHAVQNGLKRIITVGFADPVRSSYLDRMKETTVNFGVELFVCHSMDEARELGKNILTSR